MEIRPIRIPRSVIRDIPPPVVYDTPPPVVRGIEPPVIEVPDPVIDYPTIDVPTREEFEGMLQPEEKPVEETPETVRELPPTAPSVNVGGVNVTLPSPDVIATAGATAVIATTASLGAGLVVKKLLGAISDLLKKKKFKVKIKKVKPVLHFVLNGNGMVDVFEYSKKGTRLVDTTERIETYIRDHVEIDAFYEVTNKIIIDDSLKDQFTKEGQKRFKSLFIPPAKLAKKLSARFSF